MKGFEQVGGRGMYLWPEDLHFDFDTREEPCCTVMYETRMNNEQISRPVLDLSIFIGL